MGLVYDGLGVACSFGVPCAWALGTSLRALLFVGVRRLQSPAIKVLGRFQKQAKVQKF